jgi:hypothetical protein
LGIRTSETFKDAEVSSAIANCLSRKDVLVAIYARNENLPDSNKASEILYIRNRVKGSGCNVLFGTVQTFGYLKPPDQNFLNQMDWLGYNVQPFFSNLGLRTSRD